MLWSADHVFLAPAGHALKRDVGLLNSQVGLEDKDAVAAVVDDGFQTLPFLIDMPVKLGVVDGDSRLVGKTLQGVQVVGGDGGLIRAKDDKQADRILGKNQRHGNRLRQLGVDCLRHLAQLGIEKFTAESLFAAALHEFQQLLIERWDGFGCDAGISADVKDALMSVA